MYSLFILHNLEVVRRAIPKCSNTVLALRVRRSLQRALGTLANNSRAMHDPFDAHGVFGEILHDGFVVGVLAYKAFNQLNSYLKRDSN